MRTSDLWALQWSRSENTLYLQPLDVMVSQCRELYRDNERIADDFVPIHIGTENECRDAWKACQPTLEKRDAEKA